MTDVQLKLATTVAGVLFLCLLFAQAVVADEGMWTFDNFPSKTMGTKYGFTRPQAWLDHVRLSSLRIAGGARRRLFLRRDDFPEADFWGISVTLR